MNPKDISTSNDPDLIASVEGMRRAALLARRIAVRTNTCLILWDGKSVIRVKVDPNSIQKENDFWPPEAGVP